jgi:hypothetical protein
VTGYGFVVVSLLAGSTHRRLDGATWLAECAQQPSSGLLAVSLVLIAIALAWNLLVSSVKVWRHD